MQTRRFMNPGLLTKIRSHCVCNANLEECYNILKIENLLNSQQLPCTSKGKADILESIIGELSEAAVNNEDANYSSIVIKNFIRELISYILYNGEKTFFAKETQKENNSSKKTSPSRLSIALNVSPKKNTAPAPRKNPSPPNISKNKPPKERPINSSPPPYTLPPPSTLFFPPPESVVPPELKTWQELLDWSRRTKLLE